MEAKLKANQKKTTIKKLLKDVDIGKFKFRLTKCLDKSGKVKDEAFFSILGLHGVTLANEEKTKLKKLHSKAGKIDYLEALKLISLDLDLATINEEKWTTGHENKQPDDTRSKAPSHAPSHLSRFNLGQFNMKHHSGERSVQQEKSDVAITENASSMSAALKKQWV